MDACPIDLIWKLLIVGVENELGSRVLKIAREQGVSGGTIVLGQGKALNQPKSWFKAELKRQEIILMLVDDKQVAAVTDAICAAIKIEKQRRGYAFTLSVSDVVGSSLCRMTAKPNEKKETTMTNKAIFTIVERGAAELVVETAEKNGAKGATIINGRGAGIHETSRLFSLAIEPEKEIVLILTDARLEQTITKAIAQAVRLDQAGRGLMFTLDVDHLRGL